MALGWSQARFAAGLGITFQQVQKYESGANRISASRLYEAARLLDAPVGWFFEGLEGGGVADDRLPVVSDAEFAGALRRLPSERLRRQLYDLVDALAGER